MAKNKQADDLFDHLRARGVRKKVAKAVSDGTSCKNGKQAEALAQTALADLRSASDAIRDRVLNRDSKRSEAAKRRAHAQAQRGQAQRLRQEGRGDAQGRKARSRSSR